MWLIRPASQLARCSDATYVLSSEMGMGGQNDDVCDQPAKRGDIDLVNDIDWAGCTQERG